MLDTSRWVVSRATRLSGPAPPGAKASLFLSPPPRLVSLAFPKQNHASRIPFFLGAKSVRYPCPCESASSRVLWKRNILAGIAHRQECGLHSACPVCRSAMRVPSAAQPYPCPSPSHSAAGPVWRPGTAA